MPGRLAPARRNPQSFGMTQEEFAKILGLTRQPIAEIEAGPANPTLGTLQKIGRLFGFAVGLANDCIRAREPAARVSHKTMMALLPLEDTCDENGGRPRLSLCILPSTEPTRA